MSVNLSVLPSQWVRGLSLRQYREGSVKAQKIRGCVWPVLLIFHGQSFRNVKLQTHSEGLLPGLTSYLSLIFCCLFLSQKPDRDEWGSGVEALECALQLEKSVNQSLLDLHKLCSDHNDPHVSIKLWFYGCLEKHLKIFLRNRMHTCAVDKVGSVWLPASSAGFLKAIPM